MDHNEIVERFAQRRPNPRQQGRVSWSGSRIWCEDRVIYSYGSHFPMAVYLGEHAEYPFIKNSDKYSSSTSAHQSKVRACCPGPEVPRHLLLANSINFTMLDLTNIYLWRPGICKYLWRDKETGVYYDDYEYSGKMEDSSEGMTFTNTWMPPAYGSFKPRRKQEHPRFEEGTFFCNEVVVLKWKKKYYLSILADGRKGSEDYFIKLQGKPESIGEALCHKTSKEVNAAFSNIGEGIDRCLKNMNSVTPAPVAARQ